MNEIKYTCARGDGHTLSFYPGGGGKSGFRISNGSSDDFIDLSPEDTASFARDLAEHLGLTIEPEPFKRDAKFEDIRKGDLVRVEYTLNDFTTTRTGTAFERVRRYWYTSGGGSLYTVLPDATITILSRPEPEPEPELPTTPGAVIKLWLGEEWMRVNLGADGYWRGEWPDGDGMEVTRVELAGQCGIGWDRFEVLA